MKLAHYSFKADLLMLMHLSLSGVLVPQVHSTCKAGSGTTIHFDQVGGSTFMVR